VGTWPNPVRAAAAELAPATTPQKTAMQRLRAADDGSTDAHSSMMRYLRYGEKLNYGGQ
jgi:hypothetical protein